MKIIGIKIVLSIRTEYYNYYYVKIGANGDAGAVTSIVGVIVRMLINTRYKIHYVYIIQVKVSTLKIKPFMIE